MTSSGRAYHDNSMETILTFDNRDVQSQWSVVWSTTHIPAMDNALGTFGPQVRLRGRRRMRIGSLAVGALMTMHCRIPASALTGGFFFFMIFHIVAVVCLANPLRHFEVYLGQWSISGPGRAFRIIPMLEGIGIAMCINAIVRAINCCSVAAVAALYVVYSAGDAKLPFTYCRDFNLKPYDLVSMKETKMFSLHGPYSIKTVEFEEESHTVGLLPRAWRNVTSYSNALDTSRKKNCKETYSEPYPAVYGPPPYNFFYLEVVQYRPNIKTGRLNVPLVMTIIFVWLILWSIMIKEKVLYGRLLWNNITPWFIILPWIWTLILAGAAVCNLTIYQVLHTEFRMGAKEMLSSLTDALEVALYIHSAGVGTELIHGKALNHYASGHIDTFLNNENVWHSGILLILTGIHTGGATMCALVNHINHNSTSYYNLRESALWIIPMYSKCTSMGSYSHLVSCLIFGGLMISYMTVAFVLLKTVLHTIFEYKVKLVFREQVIVGGIILSCMALSLMFATTSGVAILESVDAIMTGVAIPFVILMELVSLLYVYRSHDFQSDIQLATEENTCSSRIGTQWQIIPFITLATLALKISFLLDAEMPQRSMLLALTPLVSTIAALPLRALHNAYRFLRHSPPHGT